MGANDAKEMLEVAKAECLRLEHELARHSRLLSHQITEVLGSDDWLVIHDGHHLLTGDDLDAREWKGEEQ